MIQRRTVSVYVLSLFSLSLLSTRAVATTYTGTLTWDDTQAELVATNAWAGTGTSITYIVDDTTSTGYWHYKYILTVDSGDSAGISHMNLETSPDFTADKIKNLEHSGTMDEMDVGWLEKNAGSTMPEGMYGIKFDSLSTGGEFTVEFDSLRLPIWGDFFAKDGSGVQVYNAGFTSPDSDPDPLEPSSNPPANVTDHILVPDTSMIPEPASVAVLALGGVMLLIRRRRK